MWTFLQLLGLFALATMAHELGHFILLKIYKVPVKKIQIFYLEFVEVNLGSIKLAAGILPIGGFTQYSTTKFDLLSKDKKIAISLGGILINFIFAYCCLMSDNLNWWFYTNAWKVAANIIPMPGNDCFQILDIIFDGKFSRKRKKRKL